MENYFIYAKEATLCSAANVGCTSLIIFTAINMWIIIILAVLILTGFVIVRVLLRLSRLRKQRATSFEIIDKLLDRKHELIPLYVESIKKYAGDQKDILIRIAESRTSAMAATVIDDKILAEQQLVRAIHAFEERSPLYPALKSDPAYAEVNNELVALEKDLELAKQVFNVRTNEYNHAVKSFPAALLAGNFNFNKEMLFVEEAEFLS